MNLDQLVFHRDSMLTTVDNPYDPRTDYDKWNMWDYENGYQTRNYLARLMNLNIDCTEAESDIVQDKAFQEIIDADVLGLYFVLQPNDKYKFPLVPNFNKK